MTLNFLEMTQVFVRVENKKGRSRTAIIVISIVVSAIVFAICFYYLRRKVRKSNLNILLQENCKAQNSKKFLS
jgi:flagellar basal body-associated protein FliL